MPRNPQYNLRDANGNVLGTLYATVDGEIAIHQQSSTEEVILGSDGIDVSGVSTDRIQDGENPAETISGTSATLSFTGTDERDIHDATDVSLSNASGASVTEDVTVDYYQGVDNTGTLLESETQSVTLADTASTTITYLTGNFPLDNVDYFVEVTTTDLTVDGIDEHTVGATYTIEQTSTGDLVTVDQAGRERARYDPMSATVSFPAVDAGSVQVNSSTPGIRLNGTETNAEDLTIRENAGAIELYDEGVGSVAGSWGLNPNLDIGNTTHAATDHESGGSLEVAHNNLALTPSDHHTPSSSSRDLQPEGMQAGLAADTAGVQYSGAMYQYVDSALVSDSRTVYLEAATNSSAGDEAVTVEVYDPAAAAVLDSLVITGGSPRARSADISASLTADSEIQVRWNVTTASATSGATFDAVAARLVVE